MRKILWKSKSCSWNYFGFDCGRRNSMKFQWFPIWNRSNNSERIITFGFGFWHFEFVYSRKKDYYQAKKKSWFKFRPKEREWNRFYRLIF